MCGVDNYFTFLIKGFKNIIHASFNNVPAKIIVPCKVTDGDLSVFFYRDGRKSYRLQIVIRNFPGKDVFDAFGRSF